MAVVSPTDQLGRPLGSLRVSVTDRCNLRCSYCLPAELFDAAFRFLPRDEILSYEEITDIAAAFVDLGVRSIRITGGEPLLRKDLPVLVANLRGLEPSLDLALTTNGLALGSLATALHAAGLDRVNVSLDALDPDMASAVAGRPVDPQVIWDNILAARACGLRVKVNTVLQQGVNDTAALPIAARCRAEGITLRFIEYMDVGQSNEWQQQGVVAGARVRDQIDARWPLEPVPDPAAADTARRYRYRDGAGEIGLINAITEPFCGGCDRARLSAAGTLYTCLFASEGVSVKDWLRVEHIDRVELRQRLGRLWGERVDRYSELRTAETSGQRSGRPEMWTVGG